MDTPALAGVFRVGADVDLRVIRYPSGPHVRFAVLTQTVRKHLFNGNQPC